MALKLLPPTLDSTTEWGRYMHTIGRVLSAVELLLSASKQHRRDSPARADALLDIADNLAELGEGIRAELEIKQRAYQTCARRRNSDGSD